MQDFFTPKMSITFCMLYCSLQYCPTKQKGSNYAECRTKKNDFCQGFLQLLYKRLPFFSKTTRIKVKMFCHITKDALNVIKIVIINALPKLQLLPFCFVGQYR